jgi:hypothetical protein
VVSAARTLAALSALAVVVASVAGCRGIIGVEDLTFEETDGGIDAGEHADVGGMQGADGATPGNADSGADSSATGDAGSGTDSPPPPPPPEGGPPPPDAACVPSPGSNACHDCCFAENMAANADLNMKARTCACVSGVCAGVCGTEAPCGQDMPQPPCQECIAAAVLDDGGACASVKPQCQGSACESVVQCWAGCQ